ncbi:MAG: 1-(5-phosphoribosyl)-5-[(5-phosphoribosylamino)methylideneamino]imidazole-4-carboxamide isomerase [Hydrogenobacter thermophilus]|uniref:1-(5-phosphoribosyl)-5-[(5- phosphoribosylamino)methylideneamino]imidazole-4- carboxamide isomerase n=1 Tax=Hydrogenobacter thermophilus TaxID=940 RepID=UPI001C793022|nr:1-(5-phosphoribosyl)-5-[(5-phosphoribosylamino)methylideneamino]imidazole-4-carboxamide isomerase [Hydrogenobacter thermophilus]QWK19979.1 MAG: 1-(5-phosphoribosyl)-5-[(5-phosphoribosylamino)methylideneamino]imidazole-4-carboxamide isomerase [Hydrogenobacter thermophilus]
MELKSFIIPAIDLKEGRVVRLMRGDFGKLKDYGLKPEDVAKAFDDAGFKRLHVVDLEGSLEGRLKNLESIRKIRKAFSGQVQVGGGVRSLEVCRSLFQEGIDLFVVGTVAIKEPEVFKAMVEEFPQRVILSVDARAGKVAVGGWKEETSLSPQELALRYEPLPIWGYLYTNIERDGSLEGVDVSIYESFKKLVKKPLIASGGVSSLEDLKRLYGVVDGVVVGKAIYEGRIKI